MRGAPLVVAIVLLGSVAAAVAHHVGSYVPRDNEVSANFKQIKFSLQAQKVDVALRMFETGALRREMRTRAAALPPGLESAVADALRERRAADAERGLVVFFAALVRDLALEATRQLADAAVSPEVRVAAGRRLLGAIWRYYNLVDFSISQIDPKTAVAVRLAYDDAEGATKEPAAGARPVSGPTPGMKRPAPPAPDPVRLADSLQRIARTLATFVEMSSTPRRSS